MKDHGKTYGRNYYQRYDYENLENAQADKIFAVLEKAQETFTKADEGNNAENFSYTDPIDGSVSKNQGYIFNYKDGSRFVFRLSGTGSSGATVRIYLEKYSENADMVVEEALALIIKDALSYS